MPSPGFPMPSAASPPASNPPAPAWAKAPARRPSHRGRRQRPPPGHHRHGRPAPRDPARGHHCPRRHHRRPAGRAQRLDQHLDHPVHGRSRSRRRPHRGDHRDPHQLASQTIADDVIATAVAWTRPCAVPSTRSAFAAGNIEPDRLGQAVGTVVNLEGRLSEIKRTVEEQTGRFASSSPSARASCSTP